MLSSLYIYCIVSVHGTQSAHKLLVNAEYTTNYFLVCECSCVFAFRYLYLSEGIYVTQVSLALVVVAIKS